MRRNTKWGEVLRNPKAPRSGFVMGTAQDITPHVWDLCEDIYQLWLDSREEKIDWNLFFAHLEVEKGVRVYDQDCEAAVKIKMHFGI